MQYRPEIDGLRTLAIVPVIIYHLKIATMSGDFLTGGFLGVDVFFVISGYLITFILLREQAETQKISITRFYQRRARRILPALFLVIFASLIMGWFVLLPSELERLAYSALAALAFVSNIFWFFELGEYGAQSGLLQPMLHTWSLAIEEQFYLVFPLLLLVLKPALAARRGLIVFAVLFVLGLVASQITTYLKPQLSFFSPISRTWEMLFGALLALVSFHWPHRLKMAGPIGWLLPKIALATLALSMWFIDLAAVHHPGIVTLPTVVATGILICCSDPKESVTRFLSLRPVVFIGKLSYSLYLWHFPVFAFGRLLSVGEPTPLEMTSWVAVTVVLSVAGYYLVEQPFRFRVKGAQSVMALVASLGLTVAAVGYITTADLSKHNRMGDLSAAYGLNEIDNQVLLAQSWSLLDELAGPDETISRRNARGPSIDERERLWFEDDARFNILIVGDSHSKDLFNALYSSDDIQADFEIARFGVVNAFPEDQMQQLYTAPNFEAADWILISTRYGERFSTTLPQIIDALKARGKRVAIVGNTPEFNWAGSLPIFDWFVRSYGQGFDIGEMNKTAWKALSNEVSKKNEDLRMIAERAELPYLSRYDLVCDPKSESCRLATPEGMKTMYDYGHWTLEGAAYFGKQAYDLGWLNSLRLPQNG